MLEGAEKYSKYVLAVTRCSDCPHDFMDDNYSLFNSKVNSANSAMRAWAKYNGMGRSALEAHFVKDDWDVFLLEIVELCFCEVTYPKWIRDGGYEYRVQMD